MYSGGTWSHISYIIRQTYVFDFIFFEKLRSNKSIMLLVVAMLLMVALPCRALTLAQMKTQGIALTKQGRYAEALPLLEKVVKQNKRNSCQWELAICRLHTYNYKGALESLENYRATQRKASVLAKVDSLQELCNIGQRAINHVQDVVLIDSMTVPKYDFLTRYKMGAESGRVMLGENGNVIFENQASDYRISVQDGQLIESHQIMGQWENWEPIAGIGSEEFNINYPWMMCDGETLYFASDSIPGLGGMDIYRTRYNSEDKTYYEPERLGMPFNSPANDYMMAFDEFHNVGWWATDRNAPEDSLNIYIFLVEDVPSYIEDYNKAVSRVKIESIADTWRQDNYDDLVSEIMNAPQEYVEVKRESIVINPTTVYQSAAQFRNTKARQLYDQSVSAIESLQDAELTLFEQRQQYAAGRKNLSVAIVANENKIKSLKKTILQLQKEYRRLENRN